MDSNEYGFNFNNYVIVQGLLYLAAVQEIVGKSTKWQNLNEAYEYIAQREGLDVYTIQNTIVNALILLEDLDIN